MLLKENWISLLFQIQNKYYWTGNDLYHQCCYVNLSTEEERSKAWLSPESESCLALQTTVLDKTILKDIVQLTRLSHTMILEVYRSVLNKWSPKSTHFSYIGVVARCKLAAVNLNQEETLEQAKAKSTDDCYMFVFQRLRKPGLLSL